MNKLIALVLVGATLFVSAPAFAVDTSISALCGPDGPESYKRPGGYCEQIGANQSLLENKREYNPYLYI
ncbi:acid shock protein [Devosia sp. CN2-171]|jgi:hypothetical protein|uniref:acid shock protein n=1 Tax=Devosia sp. CN2-171 TaxID=3400909 RepID=UPI003BF8EEB5